MYFLAKKSFSFLLIFPFNSIYYLIAINMSFLAKKSLFSHFPIVCIYITVFDFLNLFSCLNFAAGKVFW